MVRDSSVLKDDIAFGDVIIDVDGQPTRHMDGVERELHRVEGASHYYLGEREKLAEAVAICTAWLDRRGWL